jgi:hypothetical protein
MTLQNNPLPFLKQTNKMNQNTFNNNIKKANTLIKSIRLATLKGDTNKVKVLRVQLKNIKL